MVLALRAACLPIAVSSKNGPVGRGKRFARPPESWCAACARVAVCAHGVLGPGFGGRRMADGLLAKYWDRGGVVS